MTQEFICRFCKQSRIWGSSGAVLKEGGTESVICFICYVTMKRILESDG